MSDQEATLKLTLKRRYFDLIKSGRKAEEYREIKPYWSARLVKMGFFKDFHYVEFRNGYRKDSPRMLVECKGIREGYGAPYLGAPADKKVFIISLGKIVQQWE